MNLNSHEHYFNMIEYAKFYDQDAIVLDKDHSKFHEIFLNNVDLLNLNIGDFTTISSTPEHLFNKNI